MMANEKRLIFASDALRMIENSKTDNPYSHAMTRPIWELAHDCALSCVTACSTVDAAPVVHGWWKEYTHSALVRWKDGEPVWADRSVFRCGRCDFGTIVRHKYCPNCGAKMDGGVKDE